MSRYTRVVNLAGASAREIFDRISSDLERWKPKIAIPNVSIVADADRLSFKVDSPFFTGAVECHEGEAKVDGDLSFLASAFKSRVDQAIDDWVKGSKDGLG